jgi:S1-C subfamily serine protease
MEFMKMRYQLAAVFMAIHFLSATPGYCGANDSAASGSLSRVFQKVNSSVVLIVAMQRPQSLNEAKPPATVSSGVIVSKEGEVMTAAHSVYVSDTIAVQFHDGKSVKAKVVSSSAEADVALLKLESIPENMAVARFGDSDKAQVGDQVLVIGAPYGIGHTLTVGHISGRRGSRTVCQQLKPFEFLQTDAAINQGNSGGPMFDVDGKVIGIVSRILSSSGGSMGLGFAVSINTAKELLLEQKNFWIGFDAYLLSGPLAQAFNVPQDAGLLIQNVAENSPGYELGLRGGSIPAQIGNDKILVGGDIILAIQGFPVTQSVDDACAIQDVIGGFTSETEIELKVLRAGEIISLTSQPKAQ